MLKALSCILLVITAIIAITYVPQYFGYFIPPYPMHISTGTSINLSRYKLPPILVCGVQYIDVPKYLSRLVEVRVGIGVGCRSPEGFRWWRPNVSGFIALLPSDVALKFFNVTQLREGEGVVSGEEAKILYRKLLSYLIGRSYFNGNVATLRVLISNSSYIVVYIEDFEPKPKVPREVCVLSMNVDVNVGATPRDLVMFVSSLAVTSVVAIALFVIDVLWRRRCRYVYS
ncbi:MAG: hypothetical protein DRJ40_04965 [Thermoprotei archaeon]|nr:MAG: hypothetical protein DRJ40_04560 [Thermoprotei archaeon]RLE56750.1 MAG: hypothetical protein DRJ40_04965 [Thermoprotei archaeon]